MEISITADANTFVDIAEAAEIRGETPAEFMVKSAEWRASGKRAKRLIERLDEMSKAGEMVLIETGRGSRQGLILEVGENYIELGGMHKTTLLSLGAIMEVQVLDRDKQAF